MIACDSGRNLHKAIGNLLITTFSLAGWDYGAPTHSDVGGGLWPNFGLGSLRPPPRNLLYASA